jgi:hypothetical protein
MAKKGIARIAYHEVTFIGRSFNSYAVKTDLIYFETAYPTFHRGYVVEQVYMKADSESVIYSAQHLLQSPGAVESGAIREAIVMHDSYLAKMQAESKSRRKSGEEQEEEEEENDA